MRDWFGGLAADEVHVWCVELAGPASAISRANSCLSGDERERASRFRFEDLSTAFVLSHGVLRFLLGAYACEPPAGFRFGYGVKGKPLLDSGYSRLRFNLSHSGDMALYAFALDCELGVDIERVRPVPERNSIATHFFSPEECGDLARAQFEQGDAAFFRCWTRKEAYIKAIGAGLSVPLASFRVSLLPRDPPAILSIDGSASEAAAWSMYHLEPGPGYVGALAFQELGRTVRVLPSITAQEAMLVSAAS